jgi:endonuclease/exonuclease/phosphatase family metal-dependent hydrolase
LVSYNVHGCRGIDRRRSVERISEVIRGIDGDIVCLQEVDGRRGLRQLHALADATSLAPIPGPTIRTHGGDYGNAILTRLGVEQVDCVDLSFERREPRGLLDAILVAETASVRVMVTHLGLVRRERAVQIGAVLERLAEPRVDAIVLAGDFNEWWPWSLNLQRIDERMGAAPKPATFPSFLPLLALDRVWARPSEALLSLGSRRGPLERMASDHLPLVADLQIA